MSAVVLHLQPAVCPTARPSFSRNETPLNERSRSHDFVNAVGERAVEHRERRLGLHRLAVVAAAFTRGELCKWRGRLLLGVRS